MEQELNLRAMLGHVPAAEREIAEKVLRGERITDADGLHLYACDNLPFLSLMADYVRHKKHGKHTYFNRNFHIEPTNICVFTCHFCSYSRTLKKREDGWELSVAQMMEMVRKYDGKPVTEVHIVGGVHPKMNLEFFGDLLSQIRDHRPELHRKGFTAVELEYMIRKAKMSFREGLQYLKDKGLQSLPGGGAEIFDETVREKICPDKATSAQWLEIHETAHELGMPSNCTMLYGHYETYAHRIDHMRRLRELQDRTHGFNTFIPLKFRNENNEMSHLPEVSTLEDLKNYAVARIYMDNIDHLKAYWPMIGRHTTQLSLSFGVNDIDGTIDDTTKIYSMAGAEDQNPAMSTLELIDLIQRAGFQPIERDTVYNVLHDYSVEQFDPASETVGG